MKRVLIFWAIAAYSMITACNNSNRKNEQTKEKTVMTPLMSKAEWVIGSWQQTTAKGYTIEIWTKQSDTDIAGISYMVHGKDTLSAETIRLVQRDTTLYYIPTVKDQNNGKAIPFRLASITDNQMVFENPTHDFPQKITYRRITKDSLYAEISGPMNGMQQAIPFPMSRMK